MKVPSLLLFPIPTMAFVTSMLSKVPQGPHPVGLHSQYIVEESGETIHVMIPYHESDYNTVQVFKASGNYTPMVHYERMDDRALLERDVCAMITDCAGTAYSSLATFASAAATFTTSTCAGVANSLENYLTTGVCLLYSALISVESHTSEDSDTYIVTVGLQSFETNRCRRRRGGLHRWYRGRSPHTLSTPDLKLSRTIRARTMMSAARKTRKSSPATPRAQSMNSASRSRRKRLKRPRRITISWIQPMASTPQRVVLKAAQNSSSLTRRLHGAQSVTMTTVSTGSVVSVRSGSRSWKCDDSRNQILCVGLRSSCQFV